MEHVTILDERIRRNPLGLCELTGLEIREQLKNPEVNQSDFVGMVVPMET